MKNIKIENGFVKWDERDVNFFTLRKIIKYQSQFNTPTWEMFEGMTPTEQPLEDLDNNRIGLELVEQLIGSMQREKLSKGLKNSLEKPSRTIRWMGAQLQNWLNDALKGV